MDYNMDKSMSLQKLIDFTVQVRSWDDKVVGTGILVSMDGKIITCTHVIEVACGQDMEESIDTIVPVCMQQIQNSDKDLLQAKVIDFLPSTGDDLALLKLIPNKKLSIKPENIAVLGTSESSEGNEFQSFGYCEYPEDDEDKIYNIIAHGVMLKKVPQEGKTYSIQLTSSQIDKGMSGAAVLDTRRNLVIGIVSKTFYPFVDSTKNRDTSWGIDMSILKTEKFRSYGIPVQEASGTYEGVVIIKENLKSKDPDIRQKQVEILGEKKYPFALSLLIPLLSKEVEDDDGVRFWVACAIGNIGGKNAKDALIDAKKSEKDPYPLQGIEYALKKIRLI